MATALTEIPEGTAGTRPEGTPLAKDTAVEMLRELEAALAQIGGHDTRLLTEAGHVPVLIVVNAAAKQLHERICASQTGGTWRYWWSWAEAISPDATEAAARIARVLRQRPA